MATLHLFNSRKLCDGADVFTNHNTASATCSQANRGRDLLRQLPRYPGAESGALAASRLLTDPAHDALLPPPRPASAFNVRLDARLSLLRRRMLRLVRNVSPGMENAVRRCSMRAEEDAGLKELACANICELASGCTQQSVSWPLKGTASSLTQRLLD